MNIQYLRLFIVLLSFSSTLHAKYDLAICTIFQNEAPYLKEWIEFHKLQDVQHFYLYNNNSTDDYLGVLEPYIRNNEVTLVEWPYTYKNGDHAHWIRIQSGAYMDCVAKFGEETEWLAAIDADEFLYCPNGEFLSHFLRRYRKFGGVCVNWVKFGTSNIEEIPAGGLMIEYLTHCMPLNDPDNAFVKSIIQPKYVLNCKSAHCFGYKEEKYAVDSSRKRISGTRASTMLLDKVRINHYWTRTEKYFREAKINSRQKRRPKHTLEKLMKGAQRSNQNIDTTILQYVDSLRAAMQFQLISVE